jgi:hypothetical protein
LGHAGIGIDWNSRMMKSVNAAAKMTVLRTLNRTAGLLRRRAASATVTFMATKTIDAPIGPKDVEKVLHQSSGS